MSVFIPNPLANELAEKEALPAVREIAEKAEGIAKATAPVDTGAYRDSIHVESDEHGSRLVAGGGDVDYAVFIEKGTDDTPAFHTLTNAIESAK